MPTTATRAAYFVSDSTGITAETLGNALLANFPTIGFQRHTVPFVDTVAGARAVVAVIDDAARDGLSPIVFTTVKAATVRAELANAHATPIDLLGGHLAELEAALRTTASGLSKLEGTPAGVLSRAELAPTVGR
jgi:regulator of PEP synthase PpsR (kinase-PPPase family)